MSGTRVEFDDRALKEAMRTVLSLLGDPSKMYPDFSVAMQGDVFDHFRNETGPTEKWEKSRRAKLSGGSTLRDTGRLINSILSKPNKSEAVVETDTRYASIHNFGGAISGSKQKGTMPKREFMFLSDAVKKDMTSIAGDHITKAWS